MKGCTFLELLRNEVPLMTKLMAAGIVIAASVLTFAALTAAPSTASLDTDSPIIEATDLTAASAFDPLTTAYVVTSGAGGDLPGCGAVSAIDLSSGDVLYQSPHLGPRRGLSASEDMKSFVAGGGAGPDRLSFLDASSPDPSAWTALELWSPSGPFGLGSSALQVVGDDLYLSLSMRGSRRASGIGRISLSDYRGKLGLEDINPVSDFFSARREHVFQVIPDASERLVHALSWGYRTPSSAAETIESFPMHLHTLDADTLTASESPLALPPLIVNEPAGAGLRESGVHNWAQNGRIAWATRLGGGDHVYGNKDQVIVVNRWVRPELTIVDLKGDNGAGSVVTASLPADYAIAGALAGNHGWLNPGLVAVHGGDKIGVFDLVPWGTLVERARLEITPVLSSLSDDRRMMSGPLAWSADGSQIIAAGNEGDSEVLIIDVDSCGDRMTLRHTVAVCPYTEFNGASGFVTANGQLRPEVRPPASEACPTPDWWPEEERVGSGVVIGLPWVSNGG